MKKLLEILSIPFVFGEAITVYTLIACVSRCAPFPEWFGFAWRFYCGVFLVLLIGLVTFLLLKAARLVHARRNRRRRLGMVRLSLDGRPYYQHRGESSWRI